jgi:GT2 family glycosyltransferase
VTAPAITVAVCTFNRCESLRRTLQSFCTLDAKDIRWELLVVDNNSTDATRQVVEAFAGRLPIRHVFEPAQGLSHARNRAVEAAAGELVVFTDDDVEVAPGWLAAYAAAEAAHPHAVFFGGPIVPRYRRGRPSWLRDESLDLIAGILGYYDLGDSARAYCDTDPPPNGANFALRRGLFRPGEMFRPDLGVKGRAHGRGEETEYFTRIRRAGSGGAYVPAAKCFHWFEQDRLGLLALYRYGVQSGLAAARIHGIEPVSGVRLRQAGFLVRGLLQLLKGRGDRFRQCVIQVGVQEGILRSSVADGPR